MCHAVFPQMYLHGISFPELPTKESESQHRHPHIKEIFTLSIDSHARTLPSIDS